MSKHDKIKEVLFIKYPAFFKKHLSIFIFAFCISWLLGMFIVTGDFFKLMQYLGLFK